MQIDTTTVPGGSPTPGVSGEEAGFDWAGLLDTAAEKLLEYGPRVLLAILVLFIGMRIIKGLVKLAVKGIKRSTNDETLQKFLGNLLGWLLRIMLFISVAQMFGVETTSFVAILGAAGLAVGLALQGTLSNFAGGVLLLVFKPYKLGDLVETQGELGVVKEIQIFNTILLSPQNKTLIIPNGAVMNGNITNYTHEGKIRVDLTVGISYGADIKAAKDVLFKAMQDNEFVLKDPAPVAAVSELADSSVNFALMPWAHPDNYWDVYFGILEDAKYALDKNNIPIPFPQMDIHIQKED